MKNCPICDGNEFEIKYSLNDYRITNEPFKLALCKNCSLILTENAPSSKDIGRYYESEDYLEHSNKSEGWFSRVYCVVRNIMLIYKFRIIRSLRRGETILDIGAGSGQFLHFMQRKGYVVDGIELSGKARKYAKENFGLDIKDSAKLYNTNDQNKYANITLWHVLEHLYDLQKVIPRLHQLLQPEGLLIVAVPNHKSFDANHYGKFWAGWDVPRHIWHFSPHVLISLMKRYNLQLVKTRMLPLDPFFNALLSENYKHGYSIFNIFRAVLIGTFSLIVGINNINKASSVIYIFTKAK